MKRTLLACITALLLTTGCTIAQAGTILAEGNVQILEADNLIGKTTKEIVKELGVPADEGQCQVPLESPVTHKMVPFSGLHLIWGYEVGDGEEDHYTQFTLGACIINGHVVGVSRKWGFKRGGKIEVGQSSSVDRDLAQDLISSSHGFPEPLDKDELEI